MKIEVSGQREIRTFALDELRVAQEGDAKPKIFGHAAMFNSLSEDLGGFREQIAVGAFANSLQKSDVRGLWNHDSNIVLGRNKSGTLILREDEKGLYFEIDPPDTQLVRDMCLEPMRRGDVTQCSFGFRTVKDHWDMVGDEVVRTLLEVEVFDVSPVTYPAYNSTDVAVRSMPASFKKPTSDYQHANDLLRRRLNLSL